jgi:LysM repeat protein
LRKINGLSLRAKVSNGQTLLVPSDDNASEHTDFSVFNHQQTSVEETVLPLKHTVRKGETLLSIARQYHVSLAQLKQWNVGLNKIVVGQRVTVVKTSRTTQTPSRLVKNKQRPSRLAKSNKRASVKMAKNKKTLRPPVKKKVRVASTR